MTRARVLGGSVPTALIALSACIPVRSAPGDTVTASELLAVTQTCNEITFSRYATDEGERPSIAVCQLPGAVYWRADMDIDCDGIATAECNDTTDPWFQPQTSATDSKGKFIDAARLPYVVIPLPSGRFDFAEHGVELGAVVAVVYGGRLEYGVVADLGPDTIIGEASYAMAKRLGINADPHHGGTDWGVTYIAFAGPRARVAKIEDHAEALAIGKARARALLAAAE